MNVYADYSDRLNPSCYTQGREGCTVLALICHNTAGPNDSNPGDQATSDAAARYLCSNDRQVSVHWVVGAEGCGAPIYKVVPETSIAYHCGGSPGYPSHWVDPDNGQTYTQYGLNQVTIGIEVFGQPNDAIGPNQLASLKALVLDIVSRYPILKDPRRIVPHADLEGDRTDGRNWVELARQWVKDLNLTTSTVTVYPTPAYEGDPNRWKPEQTGYEVNNVFGFLKYWQEHGGLETFGYPVSGAFALPENPQIIVQYFERGRLEYHQDLRQIMLGRVGAELLDLQHRQANTPPDQQALVTQLQGQLQDLQKKYSDDEGAIASMQKRLDDQKTLLNTQGTQLQAQTAQIATLQAQLAAAQHPSGGGTVVPPAPPAAVFQWTAGQIVGTQQLWRPALEVDPKTGKVLVGGESGSGSTGVRAGAMLLASADNPKVTQDFNDGPTGISTLHLATDGRGVLYSAWRHTPPNSGWCGYFRLLSATGDKALSSGWRLGPNWANSGADIDQPDLAWSPKATKLYMVGQVQKNPPALGFAESVDGGRTWGNYIELMSNRPTGSGDVAPRITVDANDNVHVVFFWGGDVWARSRINGVWLSPQKLADSKADAWGYRYLGGVAAGNDGWAYAVGDSAQSVWVARFNPNSGQWEQCSKDALKGATNPRYSDVTVLPDGRVFLALGYDAGQPSGKGLEVSWSSDHGLTFTLPQTILAHDRDSEVVQIAATPRGGLAAAITFKNPRETYLITTV